MCGVRGGDFATYAYPPGEQSGRYQQYIDQVLPPPRAFLPCGDPGLAERGIACNEDHPNKLHLETSQARVRRLGHDAEDV